MSTDDSNRAGQMKFSLQSLLALTFVMAIGIALGIAYRKNNGLIEKRDELLSLSSRLQVTDEDALSVEESPQLVHEFETWDVHVPERHEFELRLGIGDVFAQGVPEVVDQVPLSAGRHRVTLRRQDRVSDNFSYVVFVDGQQVMQRSMGSEWMPTGWSQAGSTSWPRGMNFSPAPIQLAAKRYIAKIDVGENNYFNSGNDSYVTRPGYRLWIDVVDRTYRAPSPFMGFQMDPSYQGVGLRDGLRYRAFSRSPYQWTLVRPASNSDDPVLRIVPEFFVDGKSILSDQTKSFQNWKLQNDPLGKQSRNWQRESGQTEYSGFLHAKLQPKAPATPVVEIKWDANRPDEVGLRLAETTANQSLTRWRLRLGDGAEHFWRTVQIGEKTIEAHAVTETVTQLDLQGDETKVNFRWQTDQSLPLQVLQRQKATRQLYTGLDVYEGLPLSFGMEIPKTLDPIISVVRTDQHPNTPGKAFPGGPVFTELLVDLSAKEHEWIWLRAEQRDSNVREEPVASGN